MSISSDFLLDESYAPAGKSTQYIGPSMFSLLNVD